MMYWYGNGMSGWGMTLMTIGNVALWALVIAAVVLLVRALQRRSEPEDRQRPTPEELLAERFARGEIDEPTYRRDYETLQQSRHSTVDR